MYTLGEQMDSLPEEKQLVVGVGTWPHFCPPPSTCSPKGNRAGVALGCRLAGARVALGYEAEREGADLGCKEGRAGADPVCREDGVGPGRRGMGQGGHSNAEGW